MPSPSRAISNLKGQPMFQIFTRCKELELAGKRIRHFELGDPNFATPQSITEAAVTALRDGKTHYVSSRGDNDLLEAIQIATSHSRQFTPQKSQITVTPGANAGIFYALKAICDPGDEILIPNPYFPTYIAAAHLAGAEVCFYPLSASNQFRPCATELRSLVGSRTKAILINSPSNPTGAVFDESTVEFIYKLAAEYDLYVISDEVYARMIFDKAAKFYTPATIDQCKERTVIINGFSKTFAMTGWRIGAVIAPSDLSERITVISESIVSCVPGFIQSAAKQALLAPLSETSEMYAAYRSRQLALTLEFSKVEGIECSLPQGSMYVFPSIHRISRSSESFAMHLLSETGVACVPGSYFGSQGEGHLRFSCAGEDRDIDGLSFLIQQAITSYQGN